MLTLMAAAFAVSPEVVLARVDEITPLRASLADKHKPSIPRDAYAAAAGGKVPTGLVSVADASHKKAWGVAVLDVPIDRLWAAINDDPSKPTYTPLEYVEILKGRACQAPRRVFQFVPVPLLSDRWWVIDVGYNEPLAAASQGRVREQHWATDGNFDTPTATSQAWADKGIHVGFTRGSWVLIDLDGASTLVEYYTWADPGGSLPAGIANSFADNGISDTLTNMARLAKAGPTCLK